MRLVRSSAGVTLAEHAGRYGTVVTSESLQYLDLDKALPLIATLLKPGGRLLLEVHTFPKIFTPIMFLDHPHTYHWSFAGAIQLVRTAGFRIITSRQFPFPITIPLKSWVTPNHWKYIFGKHFARLSYVYCYPM